GDLDRPRRDHRRAREHRLHDRRLASHGSAAAALHRFRLDPWRPADRTGERPCGALWRAARAQAVQAQARDRFRTLSHGRGAALRREPHGGMMLLGIPMGELAMLAVAVVVAGVFTGL